MPDELQVVYTPVFKNTLARLWYFLAHNYSEELANDVREQIRISINKKLAINPFLGPVSERLMSMGIKKYRQLLVAEHNLIFYKVENDKLVILAVMDTRQNISDVLYNALLQY